MPYLKRDGVALYYEEAGTGAPPLLLVHGFCGDRTHMTPLFEHFRAGHRVVNVDRRGHGESAQPRQEYTIEGFADDLAWLSGALGLYKPVVVVHSQDKIAFDLAARYPELPGALVVLDGPVFAPAPVEEAFNGLSAALHTPSYREVLEQFLSNAAFLPTDDPARKAAIVNAVCSHHQWFVSTVWDNYLSYDLATAAARCTVPVLLVRGLFPSDPERLRQLCPQLVVGQTVGSGHFIQLEVPDQVIPMIERFLRVSVPAAAEPAVAGAR
jgi:pimeloyl-ACP methyl ester carboxylesterase